MGIIESLIHFFKQPPELTKDQVPEGVCPNCWGEQEYDNKIRDMYEDKQIDVNNATSNHAFIKDFVVTQISGIKLVRGNKGYACPTCRTID